MTPSGPVSISRESRVREERPREGALVGRAVDAEGGRLFGRTSANHVGPALTILVVGGMRQVPAGRIPA